MQKSLSGYYPVNSASNLIVGSLSQVVIVTGWSSPVKIASKLAKNEYAAIGSLYSVKTGINFLLRNLIANPEVEIVYGLKLTPQDEISGSLDRLGELFLNRKYLHLIGEEIPAKCVERLLNRVLYFEHTNLEEAIANIKDQAEFYNSSLYQNSWELKNRRDRHGKDFGLTFKQPHIDSTTTAIATSPSGITVREDTLEQTWLRLVETVYRHGYSTYSRHGCGLKEIRNVTAIIDCNRQATTENVLDFDLTPFSREFVDKYISSFVWSENFRRSRFGKKQTRDNSTYTYGDRLYSYFGSDRFRSAIAQLKRNPNSPLAIELWNSEKDLNSPQPPCLIALILQQKEDRLHLQASFRSHDIFGAWYANVAALRMFLFEATTCLKLSSDNRKLTTGELTITSSAAHIYDFSFGDVRQVLAAHKKLLKPKNNYDDKAGNYIIEKENCSIKVRREYRGETVARYNGKSVKKLYREILTDAPFLELEHCMYLGSELQKCKCAIESGASYVQS